MLGPSRHLGRKGTSLGLKWLSLLCSYCAQSAKDLWDYFKSSVCKHCGPSFLPPVPTLFPVLPCTRLRKSGFKVEHHSSPPHPHPQWFLKHFSSWLGEKKKKIA